MKIKALKKFHCSYPPPTPFLQKVLLLLNELLIVFFLNHKISYSQINDLENINLLRSYFSQVKRSIWLLIAVTIYKKTQC